MFKLKCDNCGLVVYFDIEETMVYHCPECGELLNTDDYFVEEVDI